MGQGFDAEYFPDPSRAAIYAKRYAQYLLIGNFIEQQTDLQKNKVRSQQPSLITE